ncbi:L,D-transpeptidase [candidate division KSB1 bacterium]|nr:L,D-transpeptidase [candidate division KSB1 bacterium]
MSDTIEKSSESLQPIYLRPAETGDAQNAAGAISVREKTGEAPAAPNAARKALVVGLGWGLAFSIMTLLLAPVLREWAFAILPESKFTMQLRTRDLKGLQREALRLEKRIAGLRRRFILKTPRVPYLVVNTSENRIRVMAGNQLLHEGVCSTGSYVLLKAADERQWVFFTPRGRLQVLGKRVNPVWAKPDWAFIEEGLPVPPLGSPERFEAGVLGEYALELGDGYLIHGTLYKRMLGMPVTHGCVRLGDDELRIVYRNLQIGSKVFIY